MLWDIFCKVIDNHGDIGVCWRLAAQLASRGEKVRLWVDDASALAWMAPGGHPRVQVLPWVAGSAALEPGDAIVEAFGCELDLPFQALLAQKSRRQGRQPAWINLEYLTAEPFAERTHGLPSPVLAGPARGLTKHFFYPGFTARTGGLLREIDLLERQAHFDRTDWLRRQGLDPTAADRWVSLFCYEPASLDELLARWSQGPRRTALLVTAGRAAAAVRAATDRLGRGNAGWSRSARLSITYLPLLSHDDFDRLLWSCDLNFVRGEDSLVRALWAGRPLVWQLYPQDDLAHHDKLDAFLDWLDAPPSLRAFHAGWNGIAPHLPAAEPDLDAWAEALRAARLRLLAQGDLVTQLLRFAQAGASPSGPAQKNR
ncbi:MAG TPA: elongation factor P maturation arginine rhamnosyltransferase EarP [Ramlibacter sp.]|nr:elongation factor P maturation arginine rhamnosyltransferase EarP [Ramlibacter sp.]